MNDLPTLMQLSTSPEATGTGIVQPSGVVPGAGACYARRVVLSR